MAKSVNSLNICHTFINDVIFQYDGTLGSCIKEEIGLFMFEFQGVQSIDMGIYTS